MRRRSDVLVVLATPVPAADVLHLLDGDTRDSVAVTDRRASAHALLRLVLTDLTGLAPQEHRLGHRCGTCGGSDHGRPVLHGDTVQVSLASATTAVAVAVCAGRAVGVDVEQVQGTRFDGFADVALGAQESATGDAQRARAWARKEAVLKARGTGLAVDPRSVDVRADRTGDAWVLDLDAGPGLAAAVAVVARRRPHLRAQRWDLSAAADAARSTAAAGRRPRRPATA